MTECPDCLCPAEPEPTDEERERLLADPDYEWSPPDGEYLRSGYGRMGGGLGSYVWCDRCDYFFKWQDGDE